jgi:pyrimidine 5'-nucleotidase
MCKVIFFDLDNTVYPADSGLWNAIGDRINQFMSSELGIKDEDLTPLRRYCRDHFGTTMKGLMQLYQFDEEVYLHFVHDIDLNQFLTPDSRYKDLFSTYKERKVIFTSADQNHANRILELYDIGDFIERIIDIHNTSPYVKPQPEAFRKALDLTGISDPKQCIFIDDQMDNIVQAEKLGFRAILIDQPNTNNDHECIPSILDLPSILPPTH